jgi:hypothetical protein
LGIADILRKIDEKRNHQGDPRSAYERGLAGRASFSESVAAALIAGVKGLHDPGLGEPVRLPIAGKSTETGVYIECLGLVRFTLHCVVRADANGVVYCSPVDLAMSRGGKIVRAVFEPTRGNSGVRMNKLGVTDKQFAVEPAKLLKSIEALAHQL